MDIFFSGSIRGGRDDVDLYAALIDRLEATDTVLTEHVGTTDIEAVEQEGGLTDGDIHEQDVAWLEQADVVVAEVTTPSLGVGYELGRAVAWEKPVHCLYRPESTHDLSAMIRGNDAVTVTEYDSLEEVEPELEDFLERHR
ncbi:nucleoside 2-deoxyribosyltransferase [Natronolimnobius sp. AArcel1]|uniref:nucleoside 2-deoxyribosyltransferase n=1 Tax=Natronolimnobius sp. AArcel1 TaxID=1679093 RepID=UPI0013EBD4C8|nr:nucleoside 2-deoxyribosyltransferase [Natronolimnobius sp. AArcel1]NGM68336.1 nucleoside 2-deoxyribosyltransferase [Natronolimnobius sp. AArcel1]